jgi:hypothetical protein
LSDATPYIYVNGARLGFGKRALRDVTSVTAMPRSSGGGDALVDTHSSVDSGAPNLRLDVTSTPPRPVVSVSVGITNTRMSAVKRGIAVELAVRLVAVSGTPVCLVGADPTDRDVERRLPQLIGEDPQYQRARVNEGVRSLEAVVLPSRRLCVVSVSDRAAIEAVLPELQATFRYVIIDAPSRVGTGVGIARSLLDRLDVLFVASGLTAGELADTRVYLERLAAMPRARHVAVRVLASGHPHDSAMSRHQLEHRLAGLPLIQRVPRLWGRTTNDHRPGREDLDEDFRPVIDWILEQRRIDRVVSTASPRPRPIHAHAATSLYRDAK